MLISSFSKVWTMKLGDSPAVLRMHVGPQAARDASSADQSRLFAAFDRLVSLAVKEVLLRHSNLLIERVRAGGAYPEGVPTKDSCAVGGEGSR
jgi:hypothetical protein